MSVTEEIMVPTSDSFWELGKFMKTVKRVDNGHDLCESLRQLVKQRSEIEKKYARDLVQWNKKWNSFLDNGHEYGTIQGAWRGVLSEADSLSDLHNMMGERLLSEVNQSVKVWQKENYHKSMMHFKETKEFEDGFRKAQKPWAKKLTKVLNARKDYHNTCRQEKSTANQENNARADSAVSPDGLKKLQEKLRKLQEEVTSSREKYEAALNDLNSYNAKYMEDMTEVFEKCQNFEKLRIEFFKKTLFQMHSCLDLSVDSRYAKIYTDLHGTIGRTDPDKDLKWWSSNNGVDMAMNWPAFEEYSPELQSISKRGKSQIGGGDGITITSIRHKGDYVPDNHPPPMYNSSTSQPAQQLPQAQTRSQTNNSHPAQAMRSSRQPSYDESLNPFGEDDDDDDEEQQEDEEEEKWEEAVSDNKENDLREVELKEEPEEPVKAEKSHDVRCQPPVPAPRLTNGVAGSRSTRSSKEDHIGGSAMSDDYNEAVANPFGDIVSDDDHSVEEDPITARGVQVKAVYDYCKTEDDELSFKQGEVFVKLSEEDEMGWCKGRKNGEVGLFPANYVEQVQAL